MRPISSVLTVIALLLSYQEQGYTECCVSTPFFGEINLSYDDFRGIPDGSWNGNTGGLVGANFGISFCDVLGVQAGGSYAAYDWYGRGPVNAATHNAIQQQGFATAGLFVRSVQGNGIQAGIVGDWVFNKNFGIFALSPSFGQLRYQFAYLACNSDEFGVWGTSYLKTSHKQISGIPVSYRAISQVSLFWRHIFNNYAETMLWGGVPYKKSLIVSGKREGQYIAGASFRAPFNDCLDLEAHGVFMGPVKNSTSPRFMNYDANVCLGVTYTFPIAGGRCCAGPRPYLPIANNSNFLVDTSLNN